MTVRYSGAAALCLLLSLSPAFGMTAAERDSKLDHIADLIRDRYVYKDKALAIAATLRGLKADPALQAIGDERLFASYLTAKLQPQDTHFRVSWRPASPPKVAPRLPPRINPWDDDAALRQANYGFDEVQRLAGNIGYLRLSFFADFDTALTGDKTPPARQVAEAALAFLGNSDAVIFDLRGNGGGSPAMIDLLLSPFFKDKVLLNRFYQRETDATEDSYTLSNYSGPKRPDVPLYVLTSGRTASAAEEFSYDLKTQKRGTVVGEVTAGGANPGRDVDAGGGFTIFISDGAAINPITGTNWEGTGVLPDIVVPQEEALSRAYREALKAVLAKAGAGQDKTAVRWALDLEEAKLHPHSVALEPYAGSYGLRVVTLKDGALYLQRGRGPLQKLVALRADEFAPEGAPGLRLHFRRNATGQIDALAIAEANGNSSLFEREAPKP